MQRSTVLIIALAAAICWLVLAIRPPAPLGTEAPATSFSAGRALADLVTISRAPRPVGSIENARARRYLGARLRDLGATVSEQAVPLHGKSLQRLEKWSGRAQTSVTAHNLIGVIPGRNRAKPAVMLMAHHDSVWGSPGAADDAIGVAAALEVARAIRQQGQTERDLILLFTDSEEVGLDGSTAFFDRHPLARRTGVIINMEARGAGGRANMFETGPGNGAMMRLYADRVSRPATNSLAVLIYDLMPNYTDYTVAKRKGIAGFNLALLDRGYAYHSPQATPAALDRASLQDMGDQALALASALAFAPDLPARSPNAAFADLMGRITIVYPAAAGWLLLLVSAALIGFALRQRRPTVRAVGGGAILVAAILLHGALLLTTLNAVSGSGGANYYDRLAALPRLETVAALLVAALMMLVPMARRSDPPMLAIAPAMAMMWAGIFCGGPLVALLPLGMLAMLAAWFLPTDHDEATSASVLLLLIAGIAVQATQPTAAPLFHWPLLLAALGIAARALLPERPGLAVTGLCAAVGLGHLLAQAHFIFLGIGAEMPAVTIVLLFAALPLILPLLPTAFPRWAPGIALIAALAIALWVRLDPVAPSIPVYSLAEGGTKSRD